MEGEQGSDWGCCTLCRGFLDWGGCGGVRATEVRDWTTEDIASLRTTLWVRRKLIPFRAMPTRPGGEEGAQERRKGSRRACLVKREWVEGVGLAEP